MQLLYGGGYTIRYNYGKPVGAGATGRYTNVESTGPGVNNRPSPLFKKGL